MALDWTAHLERERRRYEDGIARLPGIEDPDERQRQLTRIANALFGAGLALLMARHDTDGASRLLEAAERYRESYPDAPPGSWGRLIGAMKARVIAGDRAGAAADARWSLDEGSVGSDSPIGRYAGCLALLVLGRDGEALDVARSLQGLDDFPSPVADALAALARGDEAAYVASIKGVLGSFEQRDDYLEGIPVADTVLVLQHLADRKGIALALQSTLLPPPASGGVSSLTASK